MGAPLRKKIRNEKQSKPVIHYSKKAPNTNIADAVCEPPNDMVVSEKDPGIIWQHNLSLNQPNTLSMQQQETIYVEKLIPLDSLTMQLKPVNYGSHDVLNVNWLTANSHSLSLQPHEQEEQKQKEEGHLIRSSSNSLTINMKLKPIHCTFIHDLSSSLSSVPVLTTFNSKPNTHFDENTNFTDVKSTLTDYLFQLQKQNVTTLTNVFQQLYKNNHKSQGLGDFIRGCLFLFQFGELYHFAIQPLINHPIALLLKHAGGPSFSVNTNLISRIPLICAPLVCFIDESNTPTIHIPENIDYFGRYLYGLPVTNQTIFMYTNEIPVKSRISSNHLAKLVHLFTPTDEMESFIRSKYEQMGINNNKYMVVHVRIGDTSLILGETQSVDRVVTELDQYLLTLFNANKSLKTILISDCIALKQQLTKKYNTNLVAVFDPIAHMGEGVQLSYELVRNTMLDFYIMSRATRIVSFTTHIHGTGFSQWCATMYQIPYMCKFLK